MTTTHEAPLCHDAPPAVTWLSKYKNRQDAHSWFLSGACVLVAFTLFFDLVTGNQDLPRFALIALIAFALAMAAIFGCVGARMSPWVGRSVVIFFVLTSLFFLSGLTSEQQTVTTIQEFPLIAFYLSWFVSPRLGRVMIWIIAALFGLVIGFNPIFWFNGTLGMVSGVQALIVMVVCFEFGSVSRAHVIRRVSADPLTKSLNRNAFMSELEAAVTRASKNSNPLSLAVIDFDDFKILNDTQGHAVGDRALEEAVAHWRNNLRAKDIVGRTGGDEFAVIFDRVTAEDASQTMQRLRASSNHAWSWGISELIPGDTVETLFDRADSALYELKRSRHESKH